MRTDSREFIIVRIFDDKGFEAGYVQRDEIIRCRDCKHRYVYRTNETGTATNYYVCDFMDAQYEDNGFCHHGEKA